MPLRNTVDGDAVFLGLNMKTSREYLTSGYYALAINKRCADGRLGTRGGTVMPVNANAIAFSSILGSGVYSNPNGSEVLLIATPSNVIAISDMEYPITLSLPPGVTLSGAVTFDQNFDKVYLNSATNTLVWDGLSLAFVTNSQQSPANSLFAITPNVAWSINAANRRVFPLTPSSIGVTPINDYTEYYSNPLNQAPTIGQFRVNTSTSDPLIGAFLYSQSNILLGKRRSWDILSTFSGDLSQAAMGAISSEVGLVARKAAKMVGSDMIFPFDTGVFRIQQVIQDRIATDPLPVAAFQDQYGNIVDPIEPLLRRINWQYASGMTAAVLSPYYFLAVPLDGSTVNNAVFVYNTIKDKWESIDQWQDSNGNNLLQIDDLHVTDYQGLKRVFAVDHNAKTVYVLYEGRSDQLATGEYEIYDKVETRGYATLSSVNQFKRMEIGVATWRPSITVTELTEKANDERVLNTSRITKDPTKYSIFGKPDYVTTNVNNDFFSVGRQDYSIPDGVYFDNGGTGINIDQNQQSVLRFATMVRSRWISYRIENFQGQCIIDGTLMKATPQQRQETRAA